MVGRPPGSKRTDPPFPYTTRVRAGSGTPPRVVGPLRDRGPLPLLLVPDHQRLREAATRRHALEEAAAVDRTLRCRHPQEQRAGVGVEPFGAARHCGDDGDGFWHDCELTHAAAASLASSSAGMNASRSEEHTSELQSLMRISYAVFCLKKKTK